VAVAIEQPLVAARVDADHAIAVLSLPFFFEWAGSTMM
jgi:hypothetical protein